MAGLGEKNKALHSHTDTLHSEFHTTLITQSQKSLLFIFVSHYLSLFSSVTLTLSLVCNANIFTIFPHIEYVSHSGTKIDNKNEMLA